MSTMKRKSRRQNRVHFSPETSAPTLNRRFDAYASDTSIDTDSDYSSDDGVDSNDPALDAMVSGYGGRSIGNRRGTATSRRQTIGGADQAFFDVTEDSHIFGTVESDKLYKAINNYRRAYSNRLRQDYGSFDDYATLKAKLARDNISVDDILDDELNNNLKNAIRQEKLLARAKIDNAKSNTQAPGAVDRLASLYTAHTQNYYPLYGLVDRLAGASLSSGRNGTAYSESDEGGFIELKERGAIPKKAKRAVEKGLLKYGEDYSKLTDLTAFSLAYDSLADIQEALKELPGKLDAEGYDIVNVKNRFASDGDEPKEGYSDILINIKNRETGYVSELQIHHKGLLKLKKEAHDVYTHHHSKYWTY